MIESKIAARQLERLTGLDFFPKEAPAKKELRLAIECAMAEHIAAQVITDWLAESNACPKPAEIRKLINDRQQHLVERLRDCSICSGVGMITVWRLVTYHGNSFGIAKSEALNGDWEEVMAFNEKLVKAREDNPAMPRQTVLSAAKDCSCRAGIVKVQNA